MRTIIAGSRNINNYTTVRCAIENSGFTPTVVISGGARGVDKFGEMYAKSRGIKLEIYPANWNKFGKSAGYKRNYQMAQLSDALIAIWNGKSKGTAHMINLAKSKNLKVHVYHVY